MFGNIKQREPSVNCAQIITFICNMGCRDCRENSKNTDCMVMVIRYTGYKGSKLNTEKLEKYKQNKGSMGNTGCRENRVNMHFWLQEVVCIASVQVPFYTLQK